MPMKRSFVFSVIAFAVVLGFSALAVQQQTTKSVHAQQPAHEIVVVSQPMPYTLLQPGESVYKNVGSVGTNESMPCFATVKVWDPSTGKPAENVRLDTYCRMQNSGYAAVYFENESSTPLAVYGLVTVGIIK